MSSTTIIQLLIILQVFIMGGLAVIAAQHAIAHYRPRQKEPQKPQPQPPENYLPKEVKERLLHSSQEQFETILNHSAAQLQNDLKATTSHINDLVKRLSTEIVSGELERYRIALTRLHGQAEINMGGIRTEVAKHQAEIQAKITQELETEKQKLIKQIDTKLADAVGSFLSETLQHNVDLGSQSAYLVALLEEHKDDFIREVADETQPAG